MKLFLIATLIAVSAAARLEHLEQQQQQLRAYLPPNQGGVNSGPQPFGAIAGAYGTNGPSFNSRGAFPSASTQYLPPDHGPSSTTSSGDFAGSINGFGAQGASAPQFGQQGVPAQQVGAAPTQFGLDAAPQGSSPFGAQASFQQPPAANSPFAPHSSDNVPQQAFDEQTGYHY